MVILVWLFVLLTGCIENPAPITPSPQPPIVPPNPPGTVIVQLDKDFELESGNTALIEGTGLELKFVKIQGAYGANSSEPTFAAPLVVLELSETLNNEKYVINLFGLFEGQSQKAAGYVIALRKMDRVSTFHIAKNGEQPIIAELGNDFELKFNQTALVGGTGLEIIFGAIYTDCSEKINGVCVQISEFIVYEKRDGKKYLLKAEKNSGDPKLAYPSDLPRLFEGETKIIGNYDFRLNNISGRGFDAVANLYISKTTQ